ncbi:calcium-binding protein [Pseudodesulfovibrio sp.]|uniref:calcium-binding protein n=1 Tax=unclassified Pseudodesulfovibrio TaxID=2661612 RepID=UPI003AFFBE4A
MKAVEKELCKAILQNPDAQAQIAGAADSDERTSIIVRLGEIFGLPVSREAVERFFSSGGDEELSDRELEAVVGGKNSGPDKTLIGHDKNWWNDLWGLTNDTLVGGDGNDDVAGLGGEDSLRGGAGDDAVDGGEGNDTVYGDEGNDSVYGGHGNDIVNGGAGDDVMYGGTGDDTLDGGSGDDVMFGDQGNDFLDGGAGEDTLYGDSGHDTLHGGHGNDVLYGSTDGSVMDGGGGHDSVEGGGSADVLIGGSGDDTLDGGGGDDTLYGDGQEGSDNDWDVFVFGADDGHDTIMDFDPENDHIMLRDIESRDQIAVEQATGSTFIVYGDTRIELRDVELSEDEVWALVIDHV